MRSKVVKRLLEKGWRDLRYVWFVGIDVSKSSLDVVMVGPSGHFLSRKFENSPAGHTGLVTWCAKAAPLDTVHFCMESTGPYSFGLAAYLAQEGLLVSVENPRLIKAHAVSERFQNKTDKADAAVICDYCRSKAPKPWKLTDPQLREIHLLMQRLSDVESALQAERNRLEDKYLPERVRTSIQRSVEAHKEEVERVVHDLEACLAQRQDVVRLVRVLVKEPGVGERTAVRFLCHVGLEADGFDSAQQAAAAAGLNPVLVQSGLFKGHTRISKRGNSGIRATMYMATVCATVHNPKVKAFYQRLLANGKHKMAALAACTRKLIMILFGILKAHLKGKEPAYSATKTRYFDLRDKQRLFNARPPKPRRA
jgi:transposase